MYVSAKEIQRQAIKEARQKLNREKAQAKLLTRELIKRFMKP
jgi:hypothetical protein